MYLLSFNFILFEYKVTKIVLSIINIILTSYLKFKLSKAII